MRVRDLHRDDLPFETSLVDRTDGAPVRLERERVELLAGQVPLLGDQLGRDPLHDDLVALQELWGQVAAVRPHRHPGHHLDARRDNEVELPGPHGRGRVEVALHGRPALAIDARAAHGVRPAGDERHHPADVPALLADLRHAAELDVLDLGRVELVPRDEAVQDLAGELVAADARQHPVPASDRAADGIDDQRVGHGSQSQIRSRGSTVSPTRTVPGSTTSAATPKSISLPSRCPR